MVDTVAIAVAVEDVTSVTEKGYVCPLFNNISADDPLAKVNVKCLVTLLCIALGYSVRAVEPYR